MRRLSLLVLAISGLAIAGCGEKETPPLAADQLPSNMKTTEAANPAGGNQFSRPEGNPNARFKPRR